MYISPDLPLYQTTDHPGTADDFRILKEDKWLMDTEVKYQLLERNGLWHLTMIYVAVNDPLTFMCRKIDVYNAEKKAKTFASILQRGIRKDARGTLKTNQHAIRICDN